MIEPQREKRIVWVMDPAGLRYARENVFVSGSPTNRPRIEDDGRMLVAYSTGGKKNLAGTFWRRLWYLMPYDLEWKFRPAEAVDIDRIVPARMSME